MVDFQYWIDTFLSTPTEIGVALLVLVAVAIGLRVYPDQKDLPAVMLTGSIILVGLVILGPSWIAEWHYWLVGGLMILGIILLIDDEHLPEPLR